MKKEITNKSASVLAKLHNISRAEGFDYNHILLRYCQGRFIYRLSVSQFANNFCLKGGLFLICLNFPGIRATKDIDFLAKEINNNIKEMEKVVAKIASLDCEDGVKFVSDKIISEEIVEAGEYPGIRVKIPALIGKARIPLQLDFGWGDVVEPKMLDFPTILDDEKQPRIIAYSTEGAISEKFQAMVKLANTNSRMKDFYDIYMLSLNQSFKARELQSAIVATFKNRETELSPNCLIFQAEFFNDTDKQKQWSVFLRKHKLENVPNEFSEIMESITSFLKPLVISIVDETSIDKTWNFSTGTWESNKSRG